MLRLDDEGEKRDLLDLELRAEQLGLTDKTDLVRFFFMDARSDRRLRPNDMKLMIITAIVDGVRDDWLFILAPVADP